MLALASVSDIGVSHFIYNKLGSCSGADDSHCSSVVYEGGDGMTRLAAECYQ